MQQAYQKMKTFGCYVNWLSSIKRLIIGELFRPSFFEAVRTMPAATAAAVTARNEIEFRKYPVIFFVVIMNAFNQVSTPPREGILFFQGNQLVEFLKAICTEAVIKCVGEKGFGTVTQCDLRAGAG